MRATARPRSDYWFTDEAQRQHGLPSRVGPIPTRRPRDPDCPDHQHQEDGMECVFCWQESK